MTNEELDLLASSYLDGEATPEEVVLIERDPSLRARVEELRVAQTAMRAPVPAPSMQVKGQQLSAALAAFDAAVASDAFDRRTTLATVPEPSDSAIDLDVDTDVGPVIDLRAQREQRAEREAAAAGRMRWLSAVAGVLVFAAGAVFLVSQVNGGDDAEFATDAPTAEVATATESADASEIAPAANGDAATNAAGSTADNQTAIESEAMLADAEEDFAEEDTEEAADEDAALELAGESADAPTIDGPVIRDDLAETGFFGDEPVATFAAIPTSDELLAEVDLPWRSPDSAHCAIQVTLPEGADVIGYLPIEVPSSDAAADSLTQVVEALYLTVGNESQVLLVNPDTCESI